MHSGKSHFLDGCLRLKLSSIGTENQPFWHRGQSLAHGRMGKIRHRFGCFDGAPVCSRLNCRKRPMLHYTQLYRLYGGEIRIYAPFSKCVTHYGTFSTCGLCRGLTAYGGGVQGYPLPHGFCIAKSSVLCLHIGHRESLHIHLAIFVLCFSRQLRYRGGERTI